ncbi:hypothetical protein KBB41_00185 [Candidatus Curtissbacteria bacterium]|nr:hypothetical protein [Candidatus Curtissbacteria bacterium]
MVKKIIIVISIILLLVTSLIFFLTKQGILFKTSQDSGEIVDASQPSPTPTPIVVDLDDQSVLTTKDSKLQMIYPTVWQVENIPAQNNPDIIQAINLSSPNGDIQASIEISQQYDTEINQVPSCENTPNIICESVINNTHPVNIEKSLNNNSQTININSIFARRIFKINFTINNDANQAQNIETVNKIIATMKFF